MSFSKILNPQPPAPETSGAKYNTTTDPDWSGRDINKPRPLPGPIQPTESHGPMAPSSHQTLSKEYDTAYKRHPLPSSPIYRHFSTHGAPESYYDTTWGESDYNTYPSDSDDPTVLNDDRGSSHIYPPESAFPTYSQSPNELSNMPGKQPTLANSGTLRIQSDSPGPSSLTTQKRRLIQQNEMNPQLQKRIKFSQDQTHTERGPEYTPLDNELWEVDTFYIQYPDGLSQDSSVSEEELDIEVVWKATRIIYDDLSSALRDSILKAYALEVRFQDLSPMLKEEVSDDARRNGFIILYRN
ncbi:hypothetical protein V2G26_010747 [Clonostachys chloroleuca]